MNNIVKFAAYFCMGLMAVSAMSCGSDEWGPGPQPNPDSPVVYFDSSNPRTNYVYKEFSQFAVTISRVETALALTVPFEIYNPYGLNIPTSVSFAAGESSVDLLIDFEKDNYEMDISYPFKISIPFEYTNPYDSSVDGSVSYNSFLRRDPWLLIGTANCVFEATSGSTPAVFGDHTQGVYKDPDKGLYKMPNWCLNNTGADYGDFIFSVVDNKIYPHESVGYHGSTGRWYFYVPTATSDNESFQINGHLPNDGGIYMTYFYLYTVGSTDSGFAMDFDEEAKTARMGGYSRYSGTYSSGRFKLHYTW